MAKLDLEEKEILDSFESGEWEASTDVDELQKYQKYAAETVTKDKRINIRLTTKDFINIQKKALREGIPYQTLISSIIHKYASDQLFEKS